MASSENTNETPPSTVHVRSQTMVVVADVELASAWFQSVVGLTSAHGGPEYEMLMSGGELVIQLHAWEQDEHPHLGDPKDPSRGNGIVLWFAVDDFDRATERVRANNVTIVDGPLENPLAHHREVWVSGPEGYVVVIAGK